MKISCRPLDVRLSNLRFFGFGQFRYRPKVSANFQFRYRSLNQKGGFGRTLDLTDSDSFLEQKASGKNPKKPNN